MFHVIWYIDHSQETFYCCTFSCDTLCTLLKYHLEFMTLLVMYIVILMFLLPPIQSNKLSRKIWVPGDKVKAVGHYLYAADQFHWLIFMTTNWEVALNISASYCQAHLNTEPQLPCNLSEFSVDPWLQIITFYNCK